MHAEKVPLHVCKMLTCVQGLKCQTEVALLFYSDMRSGRLRRLLITCR